MPLAQAVVPEATHRSVEVQLAPCVQATQVPVGEQTRSWPHEDPAAASPWSVHTGAPEPHWMVADPAQGFDGVQLTPAVQLTQAWIGEQTWSVPQAYPAAR
jgi:hypothetical protein